MFKSLLEGFGLTEKETTIFLVLLRFGSQPTSMIAKRSDLNRSTVFLLLKDLVKKGLVNSQHQQGVQYFSAVPPRYLNSLLEKKRAEIEHLEQDLEKSLPLLEALQNSASMKPKIRFFEGQEAMRTLLEDTLTAEDKKLCAVLSMEDLYDVFGEEYFEGYAKRRRSGGFSLRALRNKKKDVKARWSTDPSIALEVRYLPDSMIFPSSTYIYNGKVIYFTSAKESFGVLIESEEIYQIQLNFFETLWEQCGNEKIKFQNNP